MSRYRISRRARDDLDEIWDYVKNYSYAAADRQIEMLFGKFALLARNPLLGQLRSDLRPELRMFSAGNYAILYYAKREGVEVVGVVHGARDIDAMFERGER